MIRDKMKELKAKIQCVDVVSFDMYDTLVFRSSGEAEHVFDILEILSEGKITKKKRMLMQRKAYHYIKRSKGYPHPTLNEIYVHGGENENCLKYESVENRVETIVAYPNIHMKELFEYAKSLEKRIIISSDMYLEKEQIIKILENCGFVGYNTLYLSSEIKKTKYAGDLFEYVMEKENVSPEKLLHIGDNEKSDYEIPKKLGIQTWLYEECSLDAFDSLYYIQNRIHPEVTEDNEFWYRLGFQVGGPLYLGLIQWINEKKSKIYCLSRDGFVLAKLLNEIEGKGKAEYIYSSRRALLLPAINRLGEDELNLLPPYSCGQCIGEILEYLGFDFITETDLKKHGFNGYDSTINNKTAISRLKQVYKDKEKEILQKCTEELENLKRYFETKKICKENKEICFFDSGWNGTSQYLINEICHNINKQMSEDKIAGNKFVYAGIKDNSKSRKLLKDSLYDSFFSEVYSGKELNRILQAAAVLELFFTEDAAPLKRYGSENLEFEPYTKRKYVMYINQGIEDCVKFNIDLFKSMPKDIMKKMALYNIERLLLHPTKEEAKKIGNIENIDSISASNTMKKYIAKIERDTLKKNIFLDIYWEKGIYAHPDNLWYIKVFVHLRQWLVKIKNRKKC